MWLVSRERGMAVEFEIECPDCHHMTYAVAYPGQPYDWDFQCDCQDRRWRKRP